MSSNTQIQGAHNIVIQDVKDSTVTINVNGEFIEIHKRLDKFMELLEQYQAKSFQTAEKIYNIGSITNANFDFVLGQAGWDKALPERLKKNLTNEPKPWVQDIKQVLQDEQRVSVGETDFEVFKHYGWLIEAFLLKMAIPDEDFPPPLRLSYMTEAYQSSLRYLCFIQLAQLLTRPNTPTHPLLSDLFLLPDDQSARFDYLNLLIVVTDLLKDENTFVPEISDLVRKITNSKGELNKTVLFLEYYRTKLLDNALPPDEELPVLFKEYLEGLCYWLEEISFLAKYRLVSIKDIRLEYSLGMSREFYHKYGELHGVFKSLGAPSNTEVKGDVNFDYQEIAIKDLFTFNKSVLLFNSNNVEFCLQNIHHHSNHISLSPFIIDQSVYNEVSQTPEIFYFTGHKDQIYCFSKYNNELAIGGQKSPFHKTLKVGARGNEIPRLKHLFQQMERLFAPYKLPKA